jgi:hypothetical protein
VKRVIPDETGGGKVSGEIDLPRVSVEVSMSGAHEISGVDTSATAFIGPAREGPTGEAASVFSFDEYARVYGERDPDSELAFAVSQYFSNGGGRAWIVRAPEDGESPGGLALGTFEAACLPALDAAEDLGLLCLPGVSEPSIVQAALSYADRRRLFLLVDPPAAGMLDAIDFVGALARTGSSNAAMYFPRLRVPDPGVGPSRICAPSGSVAGLYARTHRSRGIWKAPAGVEAVLYGVDHTEVELDDEAIRTVADAGIDPIRMMPATGPVVWGARTIQGAQGSDSDWKYVNVRRLALFLERSLDRGLQWAVFQPNAEPLWAEVRPVVGRFLDGIWRQGAFAGRTADEAYIVRCGTDTMTEEDVEGGHLNVLVGFAPTRPAEFAWIHFTKRWRMTAM